MKGIRTAKPEEFDRVFSILEASFPEDEYRPYKEQKALLDNPQYTVYVLPDPERNELKAFITVWQFKDFAYIEHFAVNSEYRNQGIGSLILRELMTSLPCQLCLEVELPETDFAKRRIEFYKRNGFTVNGYPYVQPPYSRERKPVPLIVMTSGRGVSQERFEKMKETIFREVYKQKSI